MRPYYLVILLLLTSCQSSSNLSKLNNSFYVVARLNNETNVFALLDTGSTFCQIPKDVYKRLNVSSKNSIDEVTTTLADGSQRKQQRGNLSQIEIEGKVIFNVPVLISEAGTPIIIGQSFLQRLNSYTIDNNKQTLNLI